MNNGPARVQHTGTHIATPPRPAPPRPKDCQTWKPMRVERAVRVRVRVGVGQSDSYLSVLVEESVQRPRGVRIRFLQRGLDGNCLLKIPHAEKGCALCVHVCMCACACVRACVCVFACMGARVCAGVRGRARAEKELAA